MRTLDSLKEVIDRIEMDDEESFKFVEDLIIQQEQGRDFKKRPLSRKQFKWLCDVHQKYCI